ncbi:MAG: hypothetical protein GWN77_00070, partial [Gammaproteobacteria bacterium]|nr:hypothetical protein [Gammaproteobacteria bacterium]
NNDWQNIGTLVYFRMRWNVDEYGIEVYARDDYGGYYAGTLATLPNDKVCLEFLMLRETAPGENDGRVEWWIDGVI